MHSSAATNWATKPRVVFGLATTCYSRSAGRQRDALAQRAACRKSSRILVIHRLSNARQRTEADVTTALPPRYRRETVRRPLSRCARTTSPERAKRGFNVASEVLGPACAEFAAWVRLRVARIRCRPVRGCASGPSRSPCAHPAVNAGLPTEPGRTTILS